MNSKTAKRRGLGVIGTLTIVLIVLKAFDLINWPWLWVISPIWISILLIIIIFSVILITGRIKKGKW